MLNQIHKLDCIKGMKKLEAGSIDLAFADPPFNIGYDYDAYDDQRESNDYLDWCHEWLSQVHRVLKDDGTFWLAIGDEYAAELKVMMQRQIGFHTRSWVIWYYTFGVNCKNKFSRSHAHLFHMVKDKDRFTFNADDPAIRIPSARQLVYGDKRANPAGRLPDDTWMRPPVLPDPDHDHEGWVLRPQDVPGSFASDEDTWFFPRVCGTFKERKGWHGCQMPEQLLARIIRSCSHEGESVLDPFTGSGTTLAVAKKLGRDWIGYEISDEYSKHSATRLESITAGDQLDGEEDPRKSSPKTSKGKKLTKKKTSKAKKKAS